MPVTTRVQLSTPMSIWTSVAVTIVLLLACLTLMTTPVAVKLPMPDDMAEAFTVAGSRIREASSGMTRRTNAA
jgi:hypothetical protein